MFSIQKFKYLYIRYRVKYGLRERIVLSDGVNKMFTPIIIDNAVRISDSDQMYQISTLDVRNSDFRDYIIDEVSDAYPIIKGVDKMSTPLNETIRMS